VDGLRGSQHESDLRARRVALNVSGAALLLALGKAAVGFTTGSIAVLSSLRRIVRLDRDRHSALVETATSLADDLRGDVQAGLARLYGSGLATSFETSPDLIGGMRIRVGSDVYDGSVRARLAAIGSRL